MDDDVVDQARLDDKEQLEKAGEADDQTFTTDVDTVPEKSLMNGKAGEGNNTVKLDADKIYRTIGSTGKWQWMMYMLHGICYVTHSWQFLGFIFIVDTPPYRCAVPPGETINSSIPKDDQCHVYTNLSINNDTEPCTHGYWFDKDYGYKSTIVTDFELYCGSNIWVEICITLSGAALALSQGLANKLTDKYGRRKMVVVGMTGRGVMGIVKAIAPNMAVFMVFDILQNVFHAVFTTAGIVMIVELWPPELRLKFGTGIEFFWLTSYATTCLTIFLFRDWRVLQILYSAPLCLSVVLLWVLPESLPWLCLNGYNKEAERVARKAAAVNGVILEDDFFTKMTSSLDVSALHKKNDDSGIDFNACVFDSGITGSISSLFGSKTLVKSSSMDDVHRRCQKYQTDEINRLSTGKGYQKLEPAIWHDPNPSIFHVFTHTKNLRRYTFINFFVWFTNGVVYMSLSLTVTMLAGDRYLNFFIYWLAEIPAIFLFFLCVNKWGRRIPLSVFLIIAGIGCICTLVELAAIDKEDVLPYLIAFNFVGKFGITASYCTLITYAPEIYPTNIRSLGFGLCWFFAILSNLIAPYSRLVERAVPGFVRGTCGVLAILAGIVALGLPETFGRILPQTIGDVERWTLSVSKEERETYKRTLQQQIDKVKSKQ